MGKDRHTYVRACIIRLSWRLTKRSYDLYRFVNIGSRVRTRGQCYTYLPAMRARICVQQYTLNGEVNSRPKSRPFLNVVTNQIIGMCVSA